MKDRFGRAAYLYTGSRNLSAHRVKAVIEVDGRRFFKGRVSCVLAGNVGKVLGGVEAFHGAQPDDGLLELGVVTAGNAVQWARTLGRAMLGEAERSPFVHVTRGRQFRVRFDRQLPYELDGGARAATRKLRIQAHHSSVRICMPADLADRSLAAQISPVYGSLPAVGYRQRAVAAEVARGNFRAGRILPPHALGGVREVPRTGHRMSGGVLAGHEHRMHEAEPDGDGSLDWHSPEVLSMRFSRSR